MVSQEFTTKAEDEYVIKGNDVLLRCRVPSFVADFVNVVGWTDSEGVDYVQGRDYGKRNSIRIPFSC